jgi:hypothetical protein
MHVRDERDERSYTLFSMPISPAYWEQLRINVEKAVKATGKPAVRLRGGPCDGWLVGDDAAMLVQEHWYDLLPEAEKWRSGPGLYAQLGKMEQDTGVATWVERSR